MNKKITQLLPLIAFILLAAFYFSGIRTVPFHPDESSYLYQSQEFEILFSDPISLAWTPDKEIDPLLRFRLLDAPLHRYSVGLVRWLADIPPSSVSVDWNWLRDWDENVAAGALPNPNVLYVSRMVSTLFTLGAIVLIYIFTQNIAGKSAALIAAILFGLNGLTLLHGRRTMAEGILLFGLSLALWCLTQAEKKPWLTGICFAFAASAKYSLAVLFPVGLFAIIWFFLKDKQGKRHCWKNAAIFLVSFGLVSWILHPVLWLHPLTTFKEMLSARQELTNMGISLMQNAGASQYLQSLGQKIIALIAHLFVAPPAFSDVGNYDTYLLLEVEKYTRNSTNGLLRGNIYGAILMVLSVFGVLSAFLDLKRNLQKERKIIILFITTSIFLFISIILIIPISFQRYYLPLLPIISIWAGIGIAKVNSTLIDQFKDKAD